MELVLDRDLHASSKKAAGLLLRRAKTLIYCNAIAEQENTFLPLERNGPKKMYQYNYTNTFFKASKISISYKFLHLHVKSKFRIIYFNITLWVGHSFEFILVIFPLPHLANRYRCLLASCSFAKLKIVTDARWGCLSSLLFPDDMTSKFDVFFLKNTIHLAGFHPASSH